MKTPTTQVLYLQLGYGIMGNFFLVNLVVPLGHPSFFLMYLRKEQIKLLHLLIIWNVEGV